jgi:indolepyruvate ferredoxin oxidoreductase alpha subunit
MASSQNEQDNRRYAVAAGLPMFEPADSQEAYDLFFESVVVSERWRIPVLFRMTTRVCHSRSLVLPREDREAPRPGLFERDIPGRVMIPAYARPAHRRLRAKLAEITAFAEAAPFNVVQEGDPKLGIVTAGISYFHAAEAAPAARFLKLGMVHPLPLERVRAFARSVERCLVVEEGDPVLADAFRAAGIAVESKPEMYRFGELDVGRVRRILARDVSPERAPPKGKPPELCPSCPYHPVYAALKKLDCIVAGDIGCYTLGVLEPYQAMDTCVAMGASVGVGLGLRHVLPPEQAKRVVSVIGDSTFVHSGISGLVEMIYNPPRSGHVLLVLDNGTTAMTGQQEHPGTGRTLDHAATGKVSIEGIARALGVPSVTVIDPFADPGGFEKLLAERLAAPDLSVIVARRPCILAAADIRKWEKQATERAGAVSCTACAKE